MPRWICWQRHLSAHFKPACAGHLKDVETYSNIFQQALGASDTAIIEAIAGKTGQNIDNSSILEALRIKEASGMVRWLKRRCGINRFRSSTAGNCPGQAALAHS